MIDAHFFIYVVESQNPADIYDGRTEAEIIQKAASLNGIPCVSRTVVDAVQFWRAMTGLVDAVKRINLTPVLHFSAHGDESGLALTDGTTLKWSTISPILRLLNDNLQSGIVVCVSSCQGFQALRMALEDGSSPFLSLVGSTGKPTWAETGVGYAAFYHHLAARSTLEDAVKAMRAASGRSDFAVIPGAAVKRIHDLASEIMAEDEMIEEIEKLALE